jgi:hypothetical protein
MGNTYGAAPFPSLLSNCVLHWTGTDETINGFPIIPSGVTVTPAGTWSNPLDLGNNKILKTFNTAGVENYISLTDNTAWDLFGSNFTVGCWVRYDTIPINTPLVCQNTGSGSFWGIRIGSYDETHIYLSIYNVPDTNSYYHCDSVPRGLNTWYHMVVQRSGSECLMYIDGNSVTVTTGIAFGTITPIAGTLDIGRCVRGETTEYFSGQMKDVFIWKGRALTVPEIKLVMARTHPTTGTGMIAGPYDYYKVIS